MNANRCLRIKIKLDIKNLKKLQQVLISNQKLENDT